MSIESKRGEGAAEELGGTIKKVAGKVLGNEQMEAEGRAKEVAGEAKQEAAKAAGRTHGKIEEMVGAVKIHLWDRLHRTYLAIVPQDTPVIGLAGQRDTARLGLVGSLAFPFRRGLRPPSAA
jgi:uncharacterized protein YjbJ (UPF0337 family)